MKKRVLIFIVSVCAVLLILTFSKSNKAAGRSVLNFYHWKMNAVPSPTVSAALNQCRTQKIYLHFFDVTRNTAAYWQGDYRSFEPTYVVRNIDKSYKKYTIIPVVYITNEVMKNIYNEHLNKLADRITRLIRQIADHHQLKVSTIQLDCDWSSTSRSAYFKLIEKVKVHYKVDVTLRLHQIKYPDKTGIPPADSATLMLYNVTKVTDMTQNSILNLNTVKQYVHKDTTYKLPLKLALPIYSQTVIEYAPGSVEISHNFPKAVLGQPQLSSLSGDLYNVNETVFHEQAVLFKGSRIQVETITPELVAECYKAVTDSRLNFDEIILYHLDDKQLNSFNLEALEDLL
jgi:hypothetical protein